MRARVRVFFFFTTTEPKTFSLVQRKFMGCPLSGAPFFLFPPTSFHGPFSLLPNVFPCPQTVNTVHHLPPLSLHCEITLLPPLILDIFYYAGPRSCSFPFPRLFSSPFHLPAFGWEKQTPPLLKDSRTQRTIFPLEDLLPFPEQSPKYLIKTQPPHPRFKDLPPSLPRVRALPFFPPPIRKLKFFPSHSDDTPSFLPSLFRSLLQTGPCRLLFLLRPSSLLRQMIDPPL